jgi:Fe-S cluster assembly iron-binding protein IscA
MALDGPRDNDEIFKVDGFTYLIDKELLAAVQPVTVDFNAIGFHISGNMAGMAGRRFC